MEETKRRSPVVAFLLSIILPGLGHVYCGKPERGLLCCLGQWVVLAIVGLSGLWWSFNGFIALIVIAFAVQIAIAVDASMAATRLKAIPLKRYNRWYVYVTAVRLFHLILYPAIIPLLQYNIIGFRAFSIPSTAMDPALKVGDHFIANLQQYGDRLPNRGDVVIFPFPEDKTKTFVKRVIGLPGERLEIKNKQVFINNQPLKDPWGVNSSEKMLSGSLSQRDNFGPVTIPKDGVFVMGDNRDASHDSRWWGHVPLKDIQGKALFIYWSKNLGRIGRQID